MRKSYVLFLLTLLSLTSYFIMSCSKDSPTTGGTVICTFTYDPWSNCVSNQQTRTFTTSPVGCTDTPPPDSLTRVCTPTPTNCTFTYSNWSTCLLGYQARTYTSDPTGCSGTPPADSLSRVCTIPPTNCTFTYSSWSTCLLGYQARTYTSIPTGCSGLPPTDSLARMCTPTPVNCTFTYSAWANCNNGIQARTYTSSPTGCTGTPPADSLSRTCCPTISFTTAVVNVLPCPLTNGSITVTATGGTAPYTYNKNSGAFQSSNIFSNLTAASYTIIAKDANGCTSNPQTIAVGTSTAGPLFNQVKSIVSSNCISCHGNSGGCNLSTDCNIVSFATRINVRCVTLATMPPTGALNTTLRAQITSWISAGGKYTD